MLILFPKLPFMDAPDFEKKFQEIIDREIKIEPKDWMP